MVLVFSFASSMSESVILRKNGLIWWLYVTIFLMKILLGEGEGGVGGGMGPLLEGSA